jgi:phosphoesterase RecJ-like protein
MTGSMTTEDDRTMTLSVPGEVVKAIGRFRAPIVIPHIVPDADALGAMYAVAIAWSSADRATKVSLPAGSVSQRLAFLSAWTDIPTAGVEDFASADGFVVVDTARKDRCNVGMNLKETDWSAGRPVVNIDHHSTNTQFGDVNWVLSDAGSTSEMIYYLLRAADRPISPLTASLLYAGIQTDTLGFTLPTTTATALAACAELVTLGADVAELGERLYRSRSRSELDLLRVVYANTRVVADGQLAYSSADYDEITGAGCTAADVDDQINVPRSINGVRLAMLFTEGYKGKTRINFRGSGNVSVVDLAMKFDGGGHKQAAGAILHCSPPEAVDKVVPVAIEHLQKFPR